MQEIRVLGKDTSDESSSSSDNSDASDDKV